MAEKLPPPPIQSSIVDMRSGLLPMVWIDFFKHAFARMGSSTASSNSEIDTTIAAMQPKLVPTGTILDYGGTAAPTGFLLCDGSAVSRTTYAALFAIIGTAFGTGDGSTTFNVPPNGKFSVSKAAGTFATLGSTGGAETSALPNHIHSVSLTTGAPSATQNETAGGVAVSSATHTHTVSGNTGNPTTNPNLAILPPYVVVNRIIKT